MATGNENESGSDLTIDLYKDVYIKFGSLDRDEDGGLQVDQQGRLAIFFEVQYNPDAPDDLAYKSEYWSKEDLLQRGFIKTFGSKDLVLDPTSSFGMDEYFSAMEKSFHQRQAIAAEGSKKSGFPAQQHQSSTDFSQHPTNVASLHHQSGSVEQQQQMAGLSQHQYHQPGFNTQCPGAPPMQQSGFYGNQRERNVNNPLEKYNFRFNNKQGAGPPDTGDGNKTTMQKDSYDQTGKYAGKTLPSGTSSTPVAPKRAWSNKGRMTANFHKTVGTPNKGGRRSTGSTRTITFICLQDSTSDLKVSDLELLTLKRGGLGIRRDVAVDKNASADDLDKILYSLFKPLGSASEDGYGGHTYKTCRTSSDNLKERAVWGASMRDLEGFKVVYIVPLFDLTLLPYTEEQRKAEPNQKKCPRCLKIMPQAEFAHHVLYECQKETSDDSDRQIEGESEK